MNSVPHKIGLSILLISMTTALTAHAETINTRTDMDTSASTTNDVMDTRTMNWDEQDKYWRENYSTRPYYDEGMEYETYQPAYRYGSDMYDRFDGKSYDTLDQSEMQRGWESYDNRGNLSWNDAQNPIRDSYAHRFNRGLNNNSISNQNTELGTTGATGTRIQNGATGSNIGTGSSMGTGATGTTGGSSLGTTR